MMGLLVGSSGAIELMLKSATLQVPAFGFQRPSRHATKGKEVSINKTVLVTYRPRYNDGSRTGDT